MILVTAIATLHSHIVLAEQYENNVKNMWLGLGRTQPWPDETTPPNPTLDTEDLDGALLGVKQITNGFLVVPRIDNNPDTGGKPYPPLSANDVFYKTQEWAPVSDDDAFKYGARWLYLETDISPSDLSYGVFRQIGIYMGLTPLPQFSNQIALKANQIQDKGYLLAYDNDLYQRYSSNDSLKEQIVIEF